MGALTQKVDKRLVVGRRHVLRELHAGGPRTPAEISSALRRLGIDYPTRTVKERVRELRDLGLVEVGVAKAVGLAKGPEPPRTGRPPLFATLSQAWGLGAGIEIGRKMVRGAVATPSGVILDQFEHPRRTPGVEQTFREAATEVMRMLDRLKPSARQMVMGVVVAVPAPVDRETRSVAADVLPGWGPDPLDSRFADLLHPARLAVRIVNDTDARAVAEGRFGLARAAHSALVLKVSGGVGGTLLRRGRILGGYRGLAGEIGHIRVSIDGLPAPRDALPPLESDAECSCGDQGGQHLESYASTSAIAQRVSAGRDRPVDFADVASEWRRAGDAYRAVNDAGRLLGQALASVVLLTDPTVIVVTGRLAALGEEAMEPVEQALSAIRPRREHIPQVKVDGPPARLDDEETRDFEWVGVQGAARWAIEATTSADAPPQLS